MRLFLIRHGQTDYNKLGIVQGSGVNTSLNQKGQMQAALFYEKYKNIAFKKVYTSALNRSIESVQKFIDKPTPWVSLTALNEISWGNTDGCKISTSEHLEYQNTIKLWSEGKVDLAMPGGESPLQVFERQKEAKNLLDSENDGSDILVCMHGRAMRIFICLLTGSPLSMMDEFMHDNLCLYVLERQNDFYKITVRNDLSHLNSLNN
ncbi:MAG: histidine phosphatase family protein [Cytophagales bacterium]